jgi:hypothetical protein
MTLTRTRAQRHLCILAAFVLMAGLAVAAQPLAADLSLAGIDEDILRGIGHFTIYGGLAFLLSAGFAGRAGAAFAVAAALAAAEELHQAVVPERTCSAGDWLLDVTGITCVLLALKLVGPGRKRATSSGSPRCGRDAVQAPSPFGSEGAW